jgi:Ulp1 family protease
LGKDSASLFTVNSAGSYGEGSILEHIKSYLAIEWEKKRGNSSPPNFCTQKVFPPQQQGGIDCGVFLISFVESIVRNFHDFANGLVQFEPVDPTRLRQYLARSIRRLSQEQGFQISQWPRLDL